LKTRRDQAKKATVIPPRLTEEAEKMMRKLRVKQILSNITGHSLKPHPHYDVSTSIRGIKRIAFFSFYAYVVAYACTLYCVAVRGQTQ
jgi:hypothetical protein